MVEVDRGVVTRETYGLRPADTQVQDLEVGSAGEAAAGAGALVLATLGLIGVLPLTFAAIAAIAVGVALLLGGGAIAARYTAMGVANPTRTQQEIAGALGFQALGGVAGIVLGILALIRVDPITLLAVASIVLGAGLIAGGSGTARLARSVRWLRGGERPVGPEPAYDVGGWAAIVGIGAVVLGILALLGDSPLTLVLGAMVALGATILFVGTFIAARLFGFFS